MRPTLKDVALGSGCSFQAVSAILGKGSERFSPELRQRVVAVAATLGYRPSSSARVLRSGRTGCVALLTGSKPSHSTVSGPVLGGIIATLTLHDTHLAFVTLAEEHIPRSGEFLPKALRQWMADGLLIKIDTCVPPELHESLRRFRIPAVWINSKQASDCVRPDDLEAGERATRHLIALGHRRIAYADYAYRLDDGETHYSAVDRHAGYRAAMLTAGLEPVLVNRRCVRGDDVRLERSLQVLSRADRPTAIVANSAYSAYPFMHAALRLGRSVPRDLSLVTFELTHQDQMGLELSRLHLPEHEIGEAAARMLIEKLRDPSTERPALALPLPLVAGDTCVPPAAP